VCFSSAFSGDSGRWILGRDNTKYILSNARVDLHESTPEIFCPEIGILFQCIEKIWFFRDEELQPPKPLVNKEKGDRNVALASFNRRGLV
jgi:hypothetical protein